jgi:putative radical SAM enzyme (TIGR03279 family)
LVDAIVKSVAPDSPASHTIIAPGDTLRRINGSVVGDVIDYKYASYDAQLLIELIGPDGKKKLVKLRKQEGADLGLEFDSYLMDAQRACANKCVFCFVDQLPRGMRETLYFKDDDIRLSFLQGNYVTLTNLTQDDIERVVRLRISPINVSVHSLDPALRARIFGIDDGDRGLEALRAFADAKIALNCQIVCCPGLNDGERLTETMDGLLELGAAVNSVSVVPVGVTRFRDGLEPLRVFDDRLAAATVRRVEAVGETCLRKRGSRVFYPADELYIAAGLELPPHDFYGEYPQLENGVGMMRLLISQFVGELATSRAKPDGKPFSVATGVAASRYITNLLKAANGKFGVLRGRVHTVRNDYFGDAVTVSGLLAGGDIIAQLKDFDLGARLLLPRNMLRCGEDVLLDDVTVGGLSEALQVPVEVVETDGADLLRAFLGG